MVSTRVEDLESLLYTTILVQNEQRLLIYITQAYHLLSYPFQSLLLFIYLFIYLFIFLIYLFTVFAKSVGIWKCSSVGPKRTACAINSAIYQLHRYPHFQYNITRLLSDTITYGTKECECTPRTLKGSVSRSNHCSVAEWLTFSVQVNFCIRRHKQELSDYSFGCIT